jgi:ankyrin repeat protein
MNRHLDAVAGLTAITAIAIGAAARGPADDRSDLSLAIRQGRLESVRAIVERNPGLVKSGDDSGFTPLHIAATAGHVDIVAYLLNQGSDIEARTAGGQTPLFQTVPLGSGDAFAYLSDKGANLHARDNRGRSILQFALEWRRPAMVERILARGFVLDVQGPAAQQLLDEAANAGVEAVVTALLNRGARIDTAARQGTTLLHSAARGGLPRFAAQVLKQGAAVDARDGHGYTALHLAAAYGRAAVIPVLLGAGADIEARLPDGRAAAALAASGGHAETVSLLDARGAKHAAPGFPPVRGPYLGGLDPGTTPRVFAPGLVSMEEHETNIAFTPDGREISVSGISLDQRARAIRVMRSADGRWTPPMAAPFTSGGTDFEMSYAADGRRLFFSSNRSRDTGGPARRDVDIWVVERDGDGWGVPRNLGPAVNTDSNEYMPSVDRAGNLYFERFGLNVARAKDGGFELAERLVIPGAANPGHPFIAPDGSYLLFDARPAEGAAGGPASVLFVSFRTGEGGWSRAVRLFEDAGTREYESCPTVSPDGRYLFFGRDDDIYWVGAGIIGDRRRAPDTRQ